MAVSASADRKTLLKPVYAAVRAGDMVLARRLAVQALAAGVEHPVLLNLRALDYEEAGRFNDSLTDLRRAHFLAPDDFTILNACGLCLAKMERPEEALRCYDQALAIEPRFGQAWFNRGWALERLGETAEAARTYAKAAEINPENAQAWANLAFLAARRGDAPAVRETASRALSLQPDHPTAVLALASIELEDPPAAERRLRALLSQTLAPVDRAIALSQLGDVLDALDKPAQAFDAYRAGNALLRKEAASRFEGQESLAETLGWMNSWAQRLDPKDWAVEELDPGEGGERSHVFLIGFARSGTTLIESFLGAHPDVVSLEERETFRAAVLAFLDSPRSLDRLASARGRELKSLRQDYWRRVREFGVEPAGKIFIDKNPFNTLKLPLIIKLFPRAKIIFALRDPRDVVLSCFRRRFGVNSATFEFLDLERTAASYDATMRLAETLREKLPIDEFRLAHEQLVADFEGQARQACDFIGAEWREGLADFAGRAQRGEIASASAGQIALGLYAGVSSEWRRYQVQLGPVSSTLAPWVEKFGYLRE